MTVQSFIVLTTLVLELAGGGGFKTTSDLLIFSFPATIITRDLTLKCQFISLYELKIS